MLPEIRLDDETFEEILEDGRSVISAVCPQWTDYNAHDPGITILELFSWFIEMQQFQLDQVTEAHKRKFLKLLGERPRPAVPAKIWLRLKGGEMALKKGEKFFAGSLCFETCREEFLPGCRLTACLEEAEGGYRRTGEEQLSFGGRSLIYPFGRRPAPGARFVLCLDGPLPPKRACRLHLMAYSGYPVRRTPAEGGMAFPLARLRAEVWGMRGWERGRILEDETCGMIMDGSMVLQGCHEMALGEMGGERGYFISLVLEEEFYDVPPALTGLGLDGVKLVQTDTRKSWEMVPLFPAGEGKLWCRTGLILKGCFMELYLKRRGKWFPVPSGMVREGEDGRLEISGTEGEAALVCVSQKEGPSCRFQAFGFPSQEFSLGFEGVLEEDFALLAEDVMEPGSFRLWERVEDFDASGPEDMHFILDGAGGRLIFGDALRGMAPEGEVRVIGLSVTRGRDGNVKSGRINACPGLEGRVQIDSFLDAAGGKEPETVEACFKRVQDSLKKPWRAVSSEDYESLAKETPGLMLQSCRVLPWEGQEGEAETVRLVARPYSLSGTAGLNRAYRQNIRAWLHERRLLGTRLVIEGPEYVEVFVYAEVRIHRQYRDAGERIQEEIARFFKELEGEFGSPVIRGKLYGRVDSLACVKEILALSIEARGSRVRRSRGGDVQIPPNGVLLLKEARCNVING